MRVSVNVQNGFGFHLSSFLHRVVIMKKLYNISTAATWMILFAFCLSPCHGPRTAFADAGLIPSAASVPQQAPQSGPEPRFTTVGGKFKKTALYILDKVGVEYEFAKLYATWIVGAPTLVVLILIGMLLRPRRRKKTAATIQRPIRIAPCRHNGSPVVDLKRPIAASDIERIVEYFLALFKQQVGADPQSATQVTLIERRPTCPNEIYEMKVKTGTDWAKRRMSIGLLGQGGGSRSKCFYVIFDSHMVIKIPSVPIPEFSVYRQRIQAEAKIVEQLYPRECIVPRMGVILKTIHLIEGSQNLSEEAQEAKYVHFLEVNPGYQKYLKIGPTFVFFMDLAKHFFLSSTLEEIRRGDGRLVAEALKQHDLLWDRHGVVCRYGEDTGAVCHELQDAYYRNEEKLRRLIDEANIIEDIPAYQLKQWFVNHLAGEKIDAVTEDLPEEFIERINHLFLEVMGRNHLLVEQYRQSVRKNVKEMHFSQHRVQLENLSSNTLELLAWIDEKRLTLRDLKPENLFVAGNPEAYPIFLNDADKFSIGLIDVETAVAMGPPSSGDIPQPQLAGTPLYATPSHLMSNIILEETYCDVRTILHMQDWYATIAIIHKIVTGKNMFSATALVFPKLLDQIRLLDPAGPDMDRDMIRINQTFWSSALYEFKHAIAMDLDLFERIEAMVPKSMVPEIINALHEGCNRLSASLALTVSQQNVFTGKEKCQFLLDAPVEKISAMKDKLVAGKSKIVFSGRQRDKALSIIVRIENQKKHLRRKLEAAAMLKAYAGPIPADQLLEAMLQRVFNTMYLPHWPVVEPAAWGGADVGVDVTTYQATL
jgi:serine/threonine protein kinase